MNPTPEANDGDGLQNWGTFKIKSEASWSRLALREINPLRTSYGSAVIKTVWVGQAHLTWLKAVLHLFSYDNEWIVCSKYNIVWIWTQLHTFVNAKTNLYQMQCLERTTFMNTCLYFMNNAWCHLFLPNRIWMWTTFIFLRILLLLTFQILAKCNTTYILDSKWREGVSSFYSYRPGFFFLFFFNRNIY